MATKKTKRKKERAKTLTPAQCVADAKNYNKSIPDRLEALSGTIDAVLGKDVHYQDVLAILRNVEESLEVRLAALNSLQAASFQSIRFESLRADYIATLRKLARDPDPEMRNEALEILSCEQDGYAQKKLLEGLENPEKALVEPELALQYLGHDIHADAYKVARDIVKNPPSESARREALKLLAADASASRVFEKVLRDKSEASETRLIAAAALRSLKPMTFSKLAGEIVQDTTDDDDMHSACLTALGHFGEDDLNEDQKLMRRAKQLKAKSKVKKSARQFLARYE